MIWIFRRGSVQVFGKRTLVKDLSKSKVKSSKQFCGKDIVGFFTQLYCATISLLRSPENLYGFQFRVHHPVFLNTKALIELSLGNFVLFAGQFRDDFDDEIRGAADVIFG